jgi:ABC-type oligopeptide transport system ATPase subunit
MDTVNNHHPLVETKALTKTYTQKNRPPIRALDGIGLEVFAGEFLVLASRSSSGKLLYST